MSDPLLPVPDAEDRIESGSEEAAEVEDDREPDVLPGPADEDAADEQVVEPASTPFRTPAAGDALDDDELRRDLDAQ